MIDAITSGRTRAKLYLIENQTVDGVMAWRIGVLAATVCLSKHTADHGGAALQSMLSLSEVPRKTSEMERARVRQCSEYVKFRLIELEKQITPPCKKRIDQR